MAVFCICVWVSYCTNWSESSLSVKYEFFSVPEKCKLMADMGSCKARIKRYYYDAMLQKCAPFIWGGCEGNQNNFETLDACNADCNDSGVPPAPDLLPTGPPVPLPTVLPPGLATPWPPAQHQYSHSSFHSSNLRGNATTAYQRLKIIADRLSKWRPFDNIFRRENVENS